MASPVDDDAELLAALQEKDGDAFAYLVDRHAGKFYGLAYRILGQKEAAEDIVQEAFLRLWRNPHGWDPNKNTRFTSWFYRVVVNLCLDLRKKAVPVNIEDVPEVCDTQPGAEEHLMTQDRERQLQNALRALSTRQRAAVQLYYYDGLAQEEAARILNMSLKAFQSLLYRSRHELQKHIQDGVENIEGGEHAARRSAG